MYPCPEFSEPIDSLTLTGQDQSCYWCFSPVGRKTTIDALSKSAVTPTYLTSYLPHSLYLTLNRRFLPPQVTPKREEPQTSLALETTCHKREQHSHHILLRSRRPFRLRWGSPPSSGSPIVKSSTATSTPNLCRAIAEKFATHYQANRIMLKSTSLCQMTYSMPTCTSRALNYTASNT